MKTERLLYLNIQDCINIYKLNNPTDGDDWIDLLRNELEAAFQPSKFITPVYLVVWDNHKKIVGFAGYSNCGFDTEIFGLTWCNVHPAYKNLGIGKMLVEERLKSISKEGGKVVLSSQREQVTWHLERFGFERLKENGECDGDKYFLMIKNL